MVGVAYITPKVFLRICGQGMKDSSTLFHAAETAAYGNLFDKKDGLASFFLDKSYRQVRHARVYG